MLREHVINFLEAAVVLLMLTNAFSVAAAVYSLALAQRLIRADARPAAGGSLTPLPRWLRLSRLSQ